MTPEDHDFHTMHDPLDDELMAAAPLVMTDRAAFASLVRCLDEGGDGLFDDPGFRRPAVFDALLTWIEALRDDEPNRAKEVAALAVRLAARMSNHDFGRAWDAWAATCDALGEEAKADAGRLVAGLYEPRLKQRPDR